METTHEPNQHTVTFVLSTPEASQAPPPTPGPLTLSVTEAGELLGISRALAYELAARGELPTLKLGRRIVVPRKALLAMVDAAGGQ